MISKGMAAAMAAAVFLAACGDKGGSKQAAQAPPPAVVVTKAEPRPVRSSDQFNGRVEAMDEVELMARVQGFLEKRLFQEGALVQPGELLFVIDKRPFEADVEQRQAELARAQAAAYEAQLQLNRGRQLLRTENIPKSEVDKREANYLMAAAQVKQAEAALTQAQIQLSYTDIRAPIAGRVGRSRFTVGALVGPQSPPLAAIVRGDPVYVDFPVSQRTLLDFRRKAAEQGRSRDVVVRLILADGSLYSRAGTIDFLDVRANPGTDTVTVRAVFPNPDGVLVPGQFANVTVESVRPVAALVVPQSAIQVDQAGAYVLVVDNRHKVEVRRIQAGPPEGGGVVVERGLKAGEQVVVEGSQKVRPGQEVQVSELPAATEGAPQ